MYIISMIVSGIVVIDFGNNFRINKVRELIFAVGISTFIFTIGVGYYTFHSALPDTELAVYIALVRGHLAIQVFALAATLSTLLVQTIHYFKNKKEKL